MPQLRQGLRQSFYGLLPGGWAEKLLHIFPWPCIAPSLERLRSCVGQLGWLASAVAAHRTLPV